MANALIYKVQTGAFALKKNAEKQSARIIEKTGFKPIIKKEGVLYKVQCGAFSKLSNANARKGALIKAGFSAIIIAVDTNANVTLIDETPKEISEETKIRVWAVHFFDEDESQYGDCTAIIEYNSDGKIIHCILIDTAKSTSTAVKKLKLAGVTTIDAIVISHAHGDHYGGLTNFLKYFSVKSLYLPDTTELDKYQKSYGNALRNQEKKAKKKNIYCEYLKAGKGFAVGDNIRCDCIWQMPASAVSEHDNHHFVNNESIVLVFTINDTWKFHTAGDLQNPGNNALIKAIPNLKADIFKCQWHGDANATNERIAKAISPKVAFSNYHHKEGSGRGTTRKRLEATGTYFMRNAEDGDIYMDIEGNTMTVTCSKNKSKKVFTK